MTIPAIRAWIENRSEARTRYEQECAAIDIELGSHLDYLEGVSPDQCRELLLASLHHDDDAQHDANLGRKRHPGGIG